ncbi:hypothetical protein [Floridanema evergladense]|uniref:Novel STAND NTPase 1 domain-containing protein n=1 Tax=Floridaenema evergladense BLCC-F167 TaxID=3153639 RepID=A0ABV4WUZ5_9CYAN
MLDCCFAGNFRWSSSRNVIPVPETIHREHYDRFIRCPAWQAITSAAHNQEAIDFLSDLRDGANNSHHSPFALALIEGLKDIKADLTGDGVITAPELYLYLRDRLLSKDGYSELQTPGLWPLQKHDRGEFIFTLPGFVRDQLKPAPPLNENNNPYRGLQPYDEKHARFFFGRQEIIEQLYNKISISAQSSSQLIAVLGISGSGKSSLVKAGLIPYLRKHHEKKWQILEPMRPGKTPFIRLASTILPIANIFSNPNSNYFQQLVQDLKQSKFQQLIDIITTWTKANPKAKLLLIIDQFEELITMSRQPNSAKNNNQTEQKNEVQQEWQQFLVLLVNLLKNCPQLHIILTLRSDFEARFVESTLKEYWDKARFPVRAMRSDELREAIEKPASEMAVYFEPANAVDRLIDEVGEMPGALPLLSFTLSEFYIKLHQAWIKDGKTDRALTVDEQFYQNGGIGGSLTHRANEIYDSLPDDAHRDTMRRVMLRMVTLEGGELVRRRVPLSELDYANKQEPNQLDEKENKRVKLVLERLNQARLIVRGQETGEPYVEPTHDFLIKGWDKLQKWVEEKQQDLLLQRRLTPAALEWKNKEKKRQFLWNANPYLDALKNIFKSRDFWFNKVEAEFVQKSVWQKSINVRSRWGIAIAVIVSLSALLASSRINEAKTLRESAEINLQNNQSLDGMVDSLKARHILNDILVKLLLLIPFNNPGLEKQIDGTLLRAVYTVKELDRQQENQSTGTVRTTFSPDGKLMASAGENCQEPIHVWNLQEQTLNKSNLFKFQDRSNNFHNSKKCEPIKIIRFSPNSQQLAIAGANGTIGIWNLQREDKKLTKLKICHTQQGEVKSISFSPNGKLLAATGANGTVIVWNLNDSCINSQILPVIFTQNKRNVWSVAFSSDGKRLATTGTGGTIRLWDGDQERNEWKENKNIKFYIDIKNKNDNIDVTSVTFSLDGHKLVTAGTDGIIRAWDLKDRKLDKLIKANQNQIWDISFSSDGKKLASAGEDSTVRLWDFNKLKNDQNSELEKFEGHQGPVRSASFSRDNQKLASAGDDGSVRLWNLQGNESEKPQSMKEASTNNQQMIIQKGIEKPCGEQTTIIIKNGDRKACGDKNGIVKWQKSSNSTFTLVNSNHVNEVTSLAFSPNSEQLASGAKDRTIRLWNDKGEQEHLLPIYAGVNSIAYSPNQPLLATAGNDGTVHLWNLQDLQEGKPWAAWKAYLGSVKKVSFSQDGKVLITEGTEGENRAAKKFWRIEPSYVIQQACDRVRDYLQNNSSIKGSDRHLCNNIKK